MKLTIKHSSITMAVCTSLYALFMITWQIPAVKQLMLDLTYIPYLPHVAMLIGMVVMGVGLFLHKEHLPKLSTSLRWQAIAIVSLTLCMALYNGSNMGALLVNGLYYFYWQSSCLHIAMILWVSAWLWQYAYAKEEMSVNNKPLGGIAILLALVSAFLLVLMLVSFVRVLALGSVAGFRVTTWLSWLRPTALVASLLAYVIGLNGDKQQEKRAIYSKANITIAWISVSVFVIFGFVAILGVGFDWFEHLQFQRYYFVLCGSCIHMLWISSVIAMLLDKGIKKWQRVLNALAPILINLSLLLILYAVYILSPGFISDILTEDVAILAFIGSLVFSIVVWLINTFTVLRAKFQAKHHNNSGEMS